MNFECIKRHISRNMLVITVYSHCVKMHKFLDFSYIYIHTNMHSAVNSHSVKILYKVLVYIYNLFNFLFLFIRRELA